MWNSLWCYASNQDIEKQDRRLYVTNQDREFHHKNTAILGPDFWKQSYGKNVRKAWWQYFISGMATNGANETSPNTITKACGEIRWEKNQVCELSKPVLEEVINHSLSPYLLKMPAEYGSKLWFRDWQRKSIEEQLNANKTLKWNKSFSPH